MMTFSCTDRFGACMTFDSESFVLTATSAKGSVVVAALSDERARLLITESVSPDVVSDEGVVVSSVNDFYEGFSVMLSDRARQAHVQVVLDEEAFSEFSEALSSSA